MVQLTDDPIECEALSRFNDSKDDLVRFCRRFIPARFHSRIEIDDVLNLVLEVALNNKWTVATSNAPLQYLRTIAKRKVIDMIRIEMALCRGAAKQGNWGQSTAAKLIGSAMAGGPTPSTSNSNNELLSLVLQQLKQLDSKDRDLIQLIVLQERSLGDVAEMLGKSKAAVRSMLYRALRELRNKICQQIPT